MVETWAWTEKVLSLGYVSGTVYADRLGIYVKASISDLYANKDTNRDPI